MEYSDDDFEIISPDDLFNSEKVVENSENIFLEEKGKDIQEEIEIDTEEDTEVEVDVETEEDTEVDVEEKVETENSENKPESSLQISDSLT